MFMNPLTKWDRAPQVGSSRCLVCVKITIFFPLAIGPGESRWHHYSIYALGWKQLSEMFFTIESPCFYLFSVFPVLYFKRYVLIISEPAIFHGFICSRCSWASHPSVFNLWQERSCCKRCLVLRVVSRSSDDMAYIVFFVCLLKCHLMDGWFHHLRLHPFPNLHVYILTSWLVFVRSIYFVDIFNLFLRPFNWNVSSLAAVASVGCSASKLYRSFEHLNFPFVWHLGLFPEQVQFL